ncbi:hydroxylysine kinase [Leptopilina boulardi]|uniref:hydroxylysine kinase n=1 Tax=Leptopilina boulardi TaxID=63433 RepID=UPI0021F53EBC|nr:hydroxylysine kinase [Leptopilina boulardi]
MSTETFLTPGQLIKPMINQETAIDIVKRVYGLNVIKIIELNAYDDKNYHILCETKKFNNQHINKISDDGYILKIVNSLDSKKINVIDAQTEMMIFLNENGICCPMPIKCIDGNYFSLENLKSSTTSDDKNVVRLLIYRPGKLLINVKKTNELMFEVGKYIGTLSNKMQEFIHTGYDNHETIWMLQSVPKIREFLDVLNQENQKIVNNIVNEFELKVICCLDYFDKGFIHGDLNEQNIVMADNERQISAIIDFGDSSKNCLIFDLTISLTYMMLQTENLESGKYVIQGYETVRYLSDKEKSIIKICVCARLCQSLVLGLYSHKNDPNNEYVLTTQKSGWKLLNQLWFMSDDTISRIWNIN